MRNSQNNMRIITDCHDSDAQETECDCGHSVQFPLVWDDPDDPIVFIGRTWCDKCLVEDFEEEIMAAALEIKSVEWAEIHAPDAQAFDSNEFGEPERLYIADRFILFSTLENIRKLNKKRLQRASDAISSHFEGGLRPAKIGNQKEQDEKR